MTKRPDALIRGIWSYVAGREVDWTAENIGLTINQSLSTPVARLRVNYKLHANRTSAARVTFQASVTVWRHSADGRVLKAAPRASGMWCRDIARQLRASGYRGRFRSAGGVWFGDFWRRIPDQKSAFAEARRFERWSRAPTWVGPYAFAELVP
jgi:hypothetical protein